ncbi:MAG: serine protease [Candidatus Micrarchaeia archaeon]
MFIPQTLSEKLLFTTVRIETELLDGSKGTGTGFFFDFLVGDKQTLPVIITNKHVIKDAVIGRFQLHVLDGNQENPKPSGKFFTVRFDNFEKRWISHPNENVDLCAMPFQPLNTEAEKRKIGIFRSSFYDTIVYDDTTLAELGAVEDILMVGYPIGLWDRTNNFPLIRKGITATHPAMNFNGKSEFVIDIACFPGSSGSPVVLVNEGMYGTKQGTIVGNRIILLGVLYAGPYMDATGDIEISEIPISRKGLSHTQIMINLGYVIKAKEIRVLGEELKRISGAP